LPEDEVLQIADDARKWEQGPRDTGGGPDPRKAATIVLDFWRQKHDPPFKRSGLIYSAAEGRELRDAELLQGAPSELIALLATAVDAKKVQDRDGNDVVDWSALPALFRKWAPTALQDLRGELDEEGANGEIVESAGEEFRRQLAAALLSLHALGKEVRVKDERGREKTETEMQRRTVIEWAAMFGTSSRWTDVRSLCIWARLNKDGVTQVAIRAELFSQIHASELSKITHNRLRELCTLYGLGAPCKVEGGDKRAVELEPTFVQELLGRGCPDPMNSEGGRTDGQSRQSASRAETASVRPS
jgi:hypothetical protein